VMVIVLLVVVVVYCARTVVGNASNRSNGRILVAQADFTAAV
jgi:hypothetical protein